MKGSVEGEETWPSENTQFLISEVVVSESILYGNLAVFEFFFSLIQQKYWTMDLSHQPRLGVFEDKLSAI